MAKISTYNIDTNITGSELLVGTEANSSPPNLTKNFKVEDVFSYVWGWRYTEFTIDDPDILRNIKTKPLVLLPPQGNNVVIIPLQLTLITYGSLVPGVSFNQYIYTAVATPLGQELTIGLDDGTGMVGATPWISGINGIAYTGALGYDGRNFATQSFACPSGDGIRGTIADANKAMLFGVLPGGNDSATGDMPVKFQFSYQLFTF